MLEVIKYFLVLDREMCRPYFRRKKYKSWSAAINTRRITVCTGVSTKFIWSLKCALKYAKLQIAALFHRVMGISGKPVFLESHDVLTSL